MRPVNAPVRSGRGGKVSESLKIGLIARCDDRGLASLTHEFYLHMKPHRVLLMRMNDPYFPDHPSRYQSHKGDVVEAWPGPKLELDEATVRGFLDGLDVVFSAETLYDWRLADWAREVGCRTVVQGMPEFYRHNQNPKTPHPDVWAWPTPWMIDELPPGPQLPVPSNYHPGMAADPDDEVLRILHVSGHAAAGGRNGTDLLAMALPSIRERVHLTIVGQDGWLPPMSATRTVTVHAEPKGLKDRWDLYRNQHVLIAPRRYGGLSLPTIEALSCGLVVVMPDCIPNAIWPGPRLRSRKGRLHHTPFGRIQTHVVHPLEIASEIDRLANNRELLKTEAEKALDWAHDNQWDGWRERYLEVLS